MFKKTGKTERISNPKKVSKDKKTAEKILVIDENGKLIEVEKENVRKDS